MPAITIVGLGPGGAELLTREAWKVLCAVGEIYVRTSRHPAVHQLPSSVSVRSFDSIYASVRRPEDVYSAICARILEVAEHTGNVTYAVPGDPAIAEATVELIREQAAERDLTIRVVSGLSFVGPTLCALGMDALPSLYLGDAFNIAALHHPPFSPDIPALVCQLHGASIASDVKLTLMNQYPDEYQVALVHSSGTDNALVEWMPLYAIDQSKHIGDLTSLHVPAMEHCISFAALQNNVSLLRSPNGCPWDREQTHMSLRSDLLEETYEVLAAIDSSDLQALQDELGDLLLQIIMQTQIAADEGEFYISDVIRGINEKLIRRHPHVFEGLNSVDADEVMRAWEAIKEKERIDEEQLGVRDGVLDSVPTSIPSLALALCYQARVSRAGFDLGDVEALVSKILSEIDDVKRAHDTVQLEVEIGDLLFAVVNWARCLEVDPEAALRMTNARFRDHVISMEAATYAQA